MGRVEKQMPRLSRSRPISCKFCRTRKLRCSRQFPCNNCTSRGLRCQQEGCSTPSMSSGDGASPEPPKFQENVLARLARLEGIVLGRQENSVKGRNFSNRPWQERYPESHPEKSGTIDVDWLDGEVTYSSSANLLLTYELEIRICSIKAVGNFPMTDANDLAEGSFATQYVWLPLYNEAKEVVDKYLADISYIHHVVHRPSLYALVDDLYRDIDGSRPIPLGRVTLLLAILATATFFWNDQDLRRPIFSSVDQANGQTPAWMRTALEVLEHSRRKGTESLEDIQSLIILSFLLTNFVGITSQVRHFYVAATNSALSLSLHRIDHPKEGAPGFPPDSLPAEMGRRVWWYLMATDWMFSQFVGPQKGTYSINPKHTATRKPLNIDDEDLIDGVPYVPKPMDQPTSISYSLQRIQIAEVCRDLSDNFPLAESVENVGYHRVLHIDQMICNIAAAMPPFFSLDYDSNQHPEADRTGVTLQRYTIHLIIYSIKCRLHMPYLSRVAADAKYTFSRDAALGAARTVIRTSRLLCQETKANIQSVSKLSGYLHFVCMAIIALLMDLCLHKSPCPNDDKERRAEIFSAFQIIEEGKEYSEFASKFLEAFYSVLRKNKVPCPPVERQSKCQPQSIEQPASFDPNEPEIITKATDRTSNTPFNDSILPTLNDLWQDFDTDMDSSVDWTALFDEFDSPFL